MSENSPKGGPVPRPGDGEFKGHRPAAKAPPPKPSPPPSPPPKSDKR